MSDEPRIAIGHVALAVSDVAASAHFYADLGLKPCFENAGMAILELRGGTHLLLFSRETGPAIPAVERVDLMIAERSRAALEAYRDGILARGLWRPARSRTRISTGTTCSACATPTGTRWWSRPAIAARPTGSRPGRPASR